MDYSYLVLRFIASGSGSDDGSKDHLLEIKRNQEHFIWSYREGNRAKAQYMKFNGGEAVLTSLERLFHLLSWDEDPYEFLQVVAPGYPMAMLKMKHLKDSWATLRPFLEGVFENWAVNTETERVRAVDDDRANPVIDEEEDESESEDSESESESSDSESESEDEEEHDCNCCEEGEIDDNKTDPEMPGLVAPEDALTTEDILRILRRGWANAREPSTPNRWSNPLNWVEEAEQRQRQEPIEVRRVVNTPNGPRTHVRYV